jgi:hypothetical protein
MEKYQIFLLISICTISFVSFSGCLTAHDNVAYANAITNQARVKSENINFENDSYATLNVKLNEVKIDYQSALSILNGSTTVLREEKTGIDQSVKKLQYNILILDYLINYEDMTEHGKKSLRYLDSGEYLAAREELSLARLYLNETIHVSISAKTAIDSLDPQSIPLEEKGRYYRSINYQYLTEKNNDYSTILDIIDDKINATDALYQANKYLQNNNFIDAKSYLLTSKMRFVNLKTNSDLLKNSQNYGISTMAITISNTTNEQILNIDRVLLIISPSLPSPVPVIPFAISLPNPSNLLPLL